MGYTNYWSRQKRIVSKKNFKSIVDDFNKIVPILAEKGIKLRDGLGENQPIITYEDVIFNGDATCGHEDFTLELPGHTLNCSGDCSHETVFFPRIILIEEWKDTTARHGKHFAFCKTARKPYDLAVGTFLIIAKHYLKDTLEVSSDGELTEEWVSIINITQSILGYGAEFKLGL